MSDHPPCDGRFIGEDANLDRIDRQIVHCLQRDGRAAFRLIAGAVGVSEQTIARRYRAMSDAGVFRVLVLPDPRHVSGENWLLRVAPRPDATERLAAVLAERSDVSWVSITGGGSEITCVHRPDPLSPTAVALLRQLQRTAQVGGFGAYKMLHMHLGGDAEWLAFDDPLSAEQVAILEEAREATEKSAASGGGFGLHADDAPLLAELERDGRASAVTLSGRLGWSRPRVSARLSELFGTGLLHTEVDVDASLLGFDSAAYLWLTVAPSRLKETGDAVAAHRECGFAAAVTGTANLVAAVNCRSDEALYEYVTTKVGLLPAVTGVEIVPVLTRYKQASTRMRRGHLPH